MGNLHGHDEIVSSQEDVVQRNNMGMRPESPAWVWSAYIKVREVAWSIALEASVHKNSSRQPA